MNYHQQQESTLLDNTHRGAQLTSNMPFKVISIGAIEVITGAGADI